MTKARIATIVALAGCAATAAAQDSVASTSGLPGDAMDPYTTGADQVSSYVVDLRPLFSSWGNTFGIAPIAKSPKSNTAFYNNLLSGNSMSQSILTGHSYASSSYSFWDAAGGGVNPLRNSAGVSIDPSFGGNETSSQFAAVVADFDQGYNGVTAVIANYNPMEPTRLFITRINAAVNGANAGENTAQLGVGSVDANGDVYFRADDFGLGGGGVPITGNNIFRVRSADRSDAVLNQISGAVGDRDGLTTDQPIVGAGTAHIVPGNIPADAVGGPQGMFVSPTFAGTLTRGFTTSISDATHLAGAATDQRGAASFSPQTFQSTSVGTLSLIGKNAAFESDRVVVIDMDATGTVVRTSGVVMTLPMTDPVDAFTLDSVVSLPEFDNYHGQANFRGSVGQTAVGLRTDGRGLAAGTVYYAGLGNNDPYDAIVVGDFDPADPAGTVNWVVAAWTDLANDGGKPIKDGPGGNTIGTMVPLFLVTGGSPLGPSISSPAIDSAGNIWFIGGVALDKVDEFGDPFIDYDSALLRAVYNPAAGGYELERILEPGFVRTGLNSCTPYQVSFLGVANGATIDSATVFSNSVNQSSWNNIDISNLDQDDPRTLGGIIVAADITYDADGDGDFDDPTSGGGDPTSLDESYQTLLYIGNIDNNKGLGWCPADMTGSVDPNSPAFGVPDGTIDANDFFFFLGQFAAGACEADLTTTVDPNAAGFGRPDGIIDANDFFYFLGLFSNGCP